MQSEQLWLPQAVPRTTHGDLAVSAQQSMAGPLTEIIKRSKYSNRTVTLIQQSGRCSIDNYTGINC